MPQTKFVLKKAIEAGHKAIVVVNKIDKPAARADWTLHETFGLFVDLGATDEQAEFPVIYGSGIAGKAGYEPDLTKMTDIRPLFDKIIEYIPAPKADAAAPLQMLTVNLVADNYKGKIAIGRLYGGTLKPATPVMYINRKGVQKKVQLTSVMVFDGLSRKEVKEAYAGDIVAISGIEDISIGETITDLLNPQPLPLIHIDEPTIKSIFGVNKSPFAGKEGQYVTSRNIKERLEKEIETDVALRVEDIGEADKWVVSGRGELHLAILIEKMRREGYELQVSKPQVIMKEENGKKLEPIEMVAIEVPSEFVGTVIQDLGKRMGIMREMKVDGQITKLEFLVPTRGLIGYRSGFMTNTKGMGIMNAIFFGYEPFKGDFTSGGHGSMVAHETGRTTNFGLINSQERGQLFIGPGVEIYEGQIVGQNAKEMDLRVNVAKEKQLSNMRAKSDGAMEFLDTPHPMGLEDALEYIGDDELVEITPKNIRMRKMDLKAR